MNGMRYGREICRSAEEWQSMKQAVKDSAEAAQKLYAMLVETGMMAGAHIADLEFFLNAMQLAHIPPY